MTEKATTPNPITCPKCGADLLQPNAISRGILARVRCAKCGSVLPDRVVGPLMNRIDNGSLAEDAGKASPASGSAVVSPTGSGPIDLLKVFAWLNLAGGIILGAFFGLGEMGPIGIGLGVAFLMEGVFGCGFLLVVCGMAENLMAIRRAVEMISTPQKA